MLDVNYIVGLVDGEGSFTVYVKRPNSEKSVKRRVRVELKFYLKLVEKDKDILYELKKFFGCGNVYFQKDTRSNHQNCYRYEVGKRSDLMEVIIPFFQKNQLLLTSKQKDFTVFCRLMELVEKDIHLTDSGLDRICRIKQQMH